MPIFNKKPEDYKHSCSFCETPCREAYRGLKSTADQPADQTRACVKCYRIQYKELYPGETLPV